MFYDGINDIAALAQEDVPGSPQNEFNRVRDFETGQKLFNWRNGVAADAAAIGAAVGRNQLLSRLLHAASHPMASAGAPATDSVLVERCARYFATNVALVQAVAREFGICAAFVWQPTIRTTNEPLSPFEQRLSAELGDSAFGGRLIVLHRLFLRRAPSILGPLIADGSVRIAADAFDSTSESLFTDRIGHTTERANDFVVPAIAERITCCTEPTDKADQRIGR